MGFISEEICGPDGVFENPPEYGLKFSFPYPTYAIPVVFDHITGEYAIEFTVLYYQYGQLIDQYEVTDNSSPYYTIEHSVLKADDIRIQIHKWSRGIRRAIIDQVGEGRINDYLLSLGDVTEQPTVSKQSLCKTITVNCFNYALSGEAKEIYKETVGTSKTETLLQINHNAAAEITASMTGGSILSQEHFTFRSVIRVSGAGELVLTGKELVETTTGIIQEINPKGEDKPPLENPLITDMQNAADTAEWVADYFAKRNHLTVPYRGSPELDVYDLIYMESQFNPHFPVRIMENTIDFNGGLTGKIKAVMV